jgi:predicted amidophosphoribosyltransferase
MGKHKKQEEDSNEADKFCPDCGERNSHFDKRCQACGKPLPKLIGQGLRVIRPPGRVGKHAKKKKE